MSERLQKVMAAAGVASRRSAEKLIAAGAVTVNNVVVTEMGIKVSPTDVICVHGRPLVRETFEYYLLNKPAGCLSSNADRRGRRLVIDYIDTKARIYPIGRLDYDTEGVLLLTNDGAFAYQIAHPRFALEKEYEAELTQAISLATLNRLVSDGVLIEGVRSYADRVSQINPQIVRIVIHEGKHHQVKLMFKALGFFVKRLRRIRVGFLTAKGLAPGAYRHLSKTEIERLIKHK